MTDDKSIPTDTGDVMLLDSIGARVVQLKPSDDVGLILDLEGRLNKLEIRDAHRYVMTASLAAELIAELVVAGQEVASRDSHLGTAGTSFAYEISAAIRNEQRRRGLFNPTNRTEG